LRAIDPKADRPVDDSFVLRAALFDVRCLLNGPTISTLNEGDNECDVKRTVGEVSDHEIDPVRISCREKTVAAFVSSDDLLKLKAGSSNPILVRRRRAASVGIPVCDFAIRKAGCSIATAKITVTRGRLCDLETRCGVSFRCNRVRS
jgi:hypothetical protein